MQHHTRYLDAKEALLDSIENDITAIVQPVLEATLEKTVDLLEDETAEREAALAPTPVAPTPQPTPEPTPDPIPEVEPTPELNRIFGSKRDDVLTGTSKADHLFGKKVTTIFMEGLATI